MIRFLRNPAPGVILLCLASLFFGVLIEPKVRGDGHEYQTTLFALSNHLGAGIRVQDTEELRAYVQVRPTAYYDPGYLAEFREVQKKGELRLFPNWARRLDGKYGAIHFWLYPLLAVPADKLLKVFSGNRLSAFNLTNALLIDFVILYLVMFSSLPRRLRLALIPLYLGVGTLYYFSWPHPEVFAASFTFLAGVALLERRSYLSVFFSAISATQNAASALLMPAAFLAEFPEWWKAAFFDKMISLAKYFLAGCLCLVPFAFFQYRFGEPSLFPTYAYLDPTAPSLARWHSVFFDLNQGVFIGMPAVFVTILMVIAARLRSPSRALEREDWLLAGSALMATGVLSVAGLNTGQVVFSRYALWIGIPMAIWATVNACRLPARSGTAVLAFLLGGQLLWSGYNLITHELNGTDAIRLNSISRFVLDRWPGLYNPQPEILIERIHGRDPMRLFAEEPSYYREKQAVAYRRANDGQITKIAFRVDRTAFLAQDICGDGKTLVTEAGLPPDPSNSHPVRWKWAYLSGHHSCI